MPTTWKSLLQFCWEYDRGLRYPALSQLCCLAFCWREFSEFTIASVLGCDLVGAWQQGETNTFYGNYRRGVEPHRRVTTYFVGALLSSLFNLLLIIYLGNTAMEIVSPFRRGGVVHKHGATTTGTTGAATV